MYAVIQWNDCEEVSVVPTAWLTEIDGECYSYWPPTSMKSCDRDRAMKKMAVPRIDWLKFPAQVLRREGIVFLCHKPICLIF